MRRHFIYLFLMVFTMSLYSCSTSKTGTASNFGKRHYNHGYAKYKKSKTSKETEVLVKSEEVEDQKLSKKEQKQELLNKVQDYLASKDLNASNTEGSVAYEDNPVLADANQSIEEGIAKLEVQKQAATSEKEANKYDKKIEKLEKFQTVVNQKATKMEEESAASLSTPTSAAGGGDRSLLALLGGIFGIVGFVFAFAPYVGWLGLLLCLAAIILGALGLNSSKRGWALTGIILGALGLVAFFLAFLLILAILL